MLYWGRVVCMLLYSDMRLIDFIVRSAKTARPKLVSAVGGGKPERRRGGVLACGRVAGIGL